MDVGDVAAAPRRASSPWVDSVEQRLEAGEILIAEGDDGTDVFEVIEGELEVVRGAEAERIDIVGEGATLGEIAALAGCPRAATVRALKRSCVRRIDGATFARWLGEDDQRLARMTDAAVARIDRQQAIAIVSELLGADRSTAADFVQLATWRHLAAGDVLFSEGDTADNGYLVVNGRLTVSRDGARIGEVGRGEFVGESGLLEQAPRTATVTSLRDTTLACLDRDAFSTVVAAHPSLVPKLYQTILARLRRPDVNVDRARSIAVTVTAEIDTRMCVARLAAELGRHGVVRHLWAARIDADLGHPGIVESGHAVLQPAVTEFLHNAETCCDYLLLETDREVTRWTRRALSLADRIVVVVSANPGEAELRRVAEIVEGASQRSLVERWLVLVHPRGTERASGAAPIADRFGFQRVTHVRAGSTVDLDRVARLISGNGTGLVLGGGGARGFAHLGVWRALDELGVDVDAISGSSIGAPLGCLMAMQIPPTELVALDCELFHDLLDYTVPVVSLVKGERITRSITRMAADLDVRDTWLPFSCVSTNLTKFRLEVHERGDSPTALRASVAIPGVLPPVPYGGDLLVDGGVFDNLPVAPLRMTGTIGRVIAVDLSPPTGMRATEDFGLSVSGWKALRNMFGAGQTRFPGLVAVLTNSLTVASARDRDRLLVEGDVDCYLNLNLSGVKVLDFERVVEVAERGYHAALPQLQSWQAAWRR
jgi:predicted acylesterase/phospholipase RssA/CRP-like cAMP-binding protein